MVMIDTIAEWDHFAAEHRTWLGLSTPSEPIFALPQAAIDELASATRSGILPNVDAQAERDLTALCQKTQAVGFRDGRPIAYPYLESVTTLPPPSQEMMDDMGWTPAQQLGIRACLERSAPTRARLKGVAGWLSVEPAFLTEVQQLAQLWATLPEDERPGFPLTRSLGIPDIPFVAALAALCERWELAGLVSWDLPEPLGPQLPIPSTVGLPASAGRGLYLAIPLHYPLLADDELLLDVFKQQLLLARERGLDASLAGLPHYKAYCQILEIVHLERTVESRYGRPRGLIKYVRQAAAAMLGITPARVQALRKAVSSCRSGRRAHVAGLQPRVR